MFKEKSREIGVYGEYGIGQSTKWIFNNTRAKIISVDTSLGWVNRIKSEIGPTDRVDLRWTDVGPVGEWGRPISYERRQIFSEYVASIWRHSQKPEMVLIDGRFRVACFLTSILHGSPGTPVFFDDYVNRPHYHIVEEVVQRQTVCGRQALFVVPMEFNRALAQDLCDHFMNVMD
uniref:Uncharacterized protein n=1 Tax=Rhodopseudomonas palustris (strain BisA53) TaxID=316055 RepID=Q07SM7_RHOP5